MQAEIEHPEGALGPGPSGGVIKDRVCAEIEGEFVVFLIGMRVNKLWKVWRWLPVSLAMPKMLKELEAQPTLGLLGVKTYITWRVVCTIQYWRSVEALQAYAHAPDRVHLPAWRRFNARVGVNGDVGIWHETYIVPAAQAESVYVNMPRFGLGAAGAIFPAKGARSSAAKRLARRAA